MTDTDDTDELLIKQPHYLNVLDDLGPYYNTVDNLITQVSNLESRINYIETSSDISLVSDCMTMQSSPRRKPQASSTQNTPIKPRTKFTVNSLPNSPDLESLKRNRSKKNDEKVPVLGEIDSFLSNVKLIKRLNTVRNYENSYASNEINRKLDLNDVNELLKDLEVKEKPIIKEKQWQSGDDIGSVPDYGFGIRRCLYPEFKQTSTLPDPRVEKNQNESSSEDTQRTAIERGPYKTRLEKSKGLDDYNLELVSLSRLWNSQGTKEIGGFQQKLQEERLRREHCERAIQELQNRILELQEREAVAIRVDEAKDKAIFRFHDSWEKADGKLQEIEHHKNLLEKEVDKLRKQLNEEIEESHQRMMYCEEEKCKALDLAHLSREKLEEVERKYNLLENDYKTMEINSEEFQKKYLLENEKNRQYPEIIAQKELELNEVKSILSEARTEILQSKKTIENCQAELISLKNINDALQTKVDNEEDSKRKLHEHKNKLLEEISAHKSVSSGLQDELTKAREQLDKNKLELKNFYQGQVELVVQTKLKEFQNQLNEAEKVLKSELSKKELQIAKTAADHIQQINEKHALEINLLEEKHQEEFRLLQLQISKHRHELEEANSKMRRQHDRQMHVERQLHKFMECLKRDNVSTPDDIQSLRSKSFNNLEEILSFHRHPEGHSMETPVSSKNEKGKVKENTFQETLQMLLEKRGPSDAAREEGYQKMVKDLKGNKVPWK